MSEMDERGRDGSVLAELAPALFAHLDTVLVGRLLDPTPRRVAFIVADALHLVEAGDRVAHVARVVDRLLALLRKGIFVAVDMIALFFAEFAHRTTPFAPGTRGPRPCFMK